MLGVALGRPSSVIVRLLVKEQQLHILVMLDTRTKEINARHMVARLNILYIMHEVLHGSGHTGGIWVFWNPHLIHLSLLDKVVNVSVSMVR